MTVAAAAGFYPALYAFDRPVVAIYALFAAVAFGVLSPLPGSGRERARAVLYALAPAAALTALGTALAVATAPAVAGMLVVGFVLTFASACGPRVAGAAPGLQLFYILACFPPYAPGTLPQRLAGLAAGALLLAAAEFRLLPEPTAPHYADHVAHALRDAAATARALARGHGDDPPAASPPARAPCTPPRRASASPGSRPARARPAPAAPTGPWPRPAARPGACWSNWPPWPRGRPRRPTTRRPAGSSTALPTAAPRRPRRCGAAGRRGARAGCWR